MSPEGYQSNTKNKKGNKVLIGKIRKFSFFSGNVFCCKTSIETKMSHSILYFFGV